MSVQFTPRELDQQRALKTAFDPQWLLNPSKVFPLDGAPLAMAAE
jgi:glycolate oxidase